MTDNPTGKVVARIVGVFAAVGAALAAGTLLFLYATGTFATSKADIGTSIMSGFVLIGVVLFGVLIGVVLAAIGGLYAARAVPDQSQATTAAFWGGAVGHGVLIVVLILGLIIGIGVLTPKDATSASGASSGGSSLDRFKNPDLTTIAELLGALLPAGLVGYVAADNFFERF